MNVSLVLTMIGPDRPGLVESLSALVASHDGNWLESRMSHLAGQFAGILRVQVAEGKANALTSTLRALETQGLTLVIQSDADEPPTLESETVHLELVGQDRPGIVSEITKAIAAQGVNVEELDTQCVTAPMSGETLFRAAAKLELPQGGSLDELKRELERIAADLMVDLTLDRDQPAGSRG